MAPVCHLSPVLTRWQDPATVFLIHICGFRNTTQVSLLPYITCSDLIIMYSFTDGFPSVTQKSTRLSPTMHCCPNSIICTWTWYVAADGRLVTAWFQLYCINNLLLATVYFLQTLLFQNGIIHGCTHPPDQDISKELSEKDMLLGILHCKCQHHGHGQFLSVVLFVEIDLYHAHTRNSTPFHLNVFSPSRIQIWIVLLPRLSARKLVSTWRLMELPHVRNSINNDRVDSVRRKKWQKNKTRHHPGLSLILIASPPERHSSPWFQKRSAIGFGKSVLRGIQCGRI